MKRKEEEVGRYSNSGWTKASQMGRVRAGSNGGSVGTGGKITRGDGELYGLYRYFWF
jgi:hypothetical protein